jgi:ribosomal protein S18 acetylase RimI-like enzyme
MSEHFANWWYFNWRPNLRKEDPARVLVAAEGMRVVGFVGFVHVYADRGAGFSPGVNPDYRRRGIGAVLTNAWAEEVKKLGALESIISTGAENLPAQRIYFGMGFEEIGRYRATMTKSLA